MKIYLETTINTARSTETTITSFVRFTIPSFCFEEMNPENSEISAVQFLFGFKYII